MFAAFIGVIINDDSAVYAVIVCHCPSIYHKSTKTAKPRIMQTMLYDSAGTLLY